MTPRSPSTDHPARPTDDAPDRLDLAAVGWVLMALVGLGAFVAATVFLLNGGVFGFDQPLLAAGQSWQGYATVWRVISESANIPLIVIGVGMVAVLFFTKHRREAVLVALVLIAVTAGSEGVKQLVARPRPSGTDPNIPGVVYSFPSGHVLEALTIFGIIAIRCVRSGWSTFAKALVVALVVLDVFLVGVARVALSAHYPSDVIASAFGGLGVLGLYGILTHRRAERAVSAEPARSSEAARST